VDFLVDFNIAEYGVTPLARFAIDGENLIGRKVDVTTVELLSDEIRTRVEKEAVPL
jgi:predicted nucleotidyltransferase